MQYMQANVSGKINVSTLSYDCHNKLKLSHIRYCFVTIGCSFKKIAVYSLGIKK